MSAKTELTDLLTQYDAGEVERKAAATQFADQNALKVGEFSSLSEAVIRPVMLEIGEELGTHGHVYVIREQEHGTGQDAGITIEVLPSRHPAEHYTSGSRPWLSFTQRSPGSPVTILRSMIMPGTAGGNGWVGTYAPAEITPDVVRDAITQWLALVLR
jgi:hypothetical protein